MTQDLQMEVRAESVGPWPMNTYALICPHTRESVLIDPGAEPERLMELLENTTPIAILLTHTHPDHIGALDEMRERLGVPVMVHKGPHVGGLVLDNVQTLTDGDTVSVGMHELNVYAAPGHTADMLCFGVSGENTMIVGDTIFEGGPGRTWSAADFETTMDTLRTVVLSWPDDTMCYPGHGPSFRLGDVLPSIQAFLDKDHGTFFGDASWDM